MTYYCFSIKSIICSKPIGPINGRSGTRVIDSWDFEFSRVIIEGIDYALTTPKCNAKVLIASVWSGCHSPSCWRRECEWIKWECLISPPPIPSLIKWHNVSFWWGSARYYYWFNLVWMCMIAMLVVSGCLNITSIRIKNHNKTVPISYRSKQCAILTKWNALKVIPSIIIFSPFELCTCLTHYNDTNYWWI